MHLISSSRTCFHVLSHTLVSIFLSFVLLGVVFSADASAQTREDCLACHEDEELTMEKGGREISLYVNEAKLSRSVHGKQRCVGCHRGYDPEELPHRENPAAVSCVSCHKNPELKHQFHKNMLLEAKKQGKINERCISCHGDHDVASTGGGEMADGDLAKLQSCSGCHEEVVADFMDSDHGTALKNGQPGAPDCISCHNRSVTPGSVDDRLEMKKRQEKLCLSCHLDNPDVRERMVKTSSFIDAYEQSVHGRALLGGNADAANCVDCHGAHEMRHTFDPDSRVNPLHIAEECGTCHDEVLAEFHESVHGVALKKGNLDSPSCSSCHGEHNILHTNDPRARVSSQNVAVQVCEPCHSSLKLSDRYGFSSSTTKTFDASYHGLALRGGATDVANCASCHGVHNIKPSTDPTSTIHKDNLATTCGNCHPGAGERFTEGKVHVTYSDKEEEPILYWIARLYIIMIIVIIGGMLLHNILDFRKKARHKLAVRRGIHPAHPRSHKLYLRMTFNERIQHFSLMISFFLLVITGFMLSYPDAWWVRTIQNLSEGVFDMRSLLHRIAGVVMGVASIYHLGYIAFTPRGRKLVADLFPRLQDAKDAIIVLKYNLGISTVKPRFGRFSYIEKSEYWALVWGNIVMIGTGLIMWFDNYFMNLFSKLGWDIARSVHFYEAWLAFLAIVVWHIYFVIFNPEAYPMNMAWIKGTLSEEEMAEEHPLELEKLRGTDEEIIPLNDQSDKETDSH